MIEAAEILRMAAALGAVIGVILIAAWFGRSFLVKMRAGMKGGRIEVVTMRNLDQRHRLALVRLDDHEHLLVLSPESATVVVSKEAPPAVEADAASDPTGRP